MSEEAVMGDQAILLDGEEEVGVRLDEGGVGIHLAAVAACLFFSYIHWRKKKEKALTKENGAPLYIILKPELVFACSNVRKFEQRNLFEPKVDGIRKQKRKKNTSTELNDINNSQINMFSRLWSGVVRTRERVGEEGEKVVAGPSGTGPFSSRLGERPPCVPKFDPHRWASQTPHTRGLSHTKGPLGPGFLLSVVCFVLERKERKKSVGRKKKLTKVGPRFLVVDVLGNIIEGIPVCAGALNGRDVSANRL